jgi:myo-inositol 2-dehydrogenase/D-chiro-inositol 1-dehydrogenase
MSSRDNPQPSLEYLKISGNIFHDMLIHDFDMLQFLLGHKVPTSVFAIGHAYDPAIAALEDFDTVLVTLKYADGLICSIDTSRTAVYGYDQRIELFAENGMAIAENERNNTVEIHTEKGVFRNPINFSFPQRYKDAYAKEIADFVDGIQNGKLVNVPKDQCLLGHLIADAAYESCVSNKVVNIK